MNDEQAPRPRVGALALLAVLAAGGVLIGYALVVRTRAGQRLDQDAFDGRGISRHARHAAGQLLSTISVGSLVLAICVLAALALARHRTTLAFVAATAITGAVFSSEILKRFVFERPTLIAGARPYLTAIPAGIRRSRSRSGSRRRSSRHGARGAGWRPLRFCTARGSGSQRSSPAGIARAMSSAACWSRSRGLRPPSS